MYNFNNPYGNYGMQNQMQNQRQSNKIYVSGIEGARSYQMMPNSEMIFLDDNQSIIYDVLTDIQGKRTINVYDVVPHKSEEEIKLSQFATKEELEVLKQEIDKLRGNKE